MPPRPPCHGSGGGITTARLVGAGAGGLLCCPLAALGSSPAPGRNAHTLAPHRLTRSPFSRQTTPQREGRGPCQIRRWVPGASPQPQVSTSSSQHEAPSQDADWEPVLSSTPDSDGDQGPPRAPNRPVCPPPRTLMPRRPTPRARRRPHSPRPQPQLIRGLSEGLPLHSHPGSLCSPSSHAVGAEALDPGQPGAAMLQPVGLGLSTQPCSISQRI